LHTLCCRRAALARTINGERSAGRHLNEPTPRMDLTRILIVDDNDMFIEMATFILNAAAYVVESAPDAHQALLKIPVFLPI
jgi:PleD family two-component response regulator